MTGGGGHGEIEVGSLLRQFDFQALPFVVHLDGEGPWKGKDGVMNIYGRGPTAFFTIVSSFAI